MVGVATGGRKGKNWADISLHKQKGTFPTILLFLLVVEGSLTLKSGICDGLWGSCHEEEAEEQEEVAKSSSLRELALT